MRGWEGYQDVGDGRGWGGEFFWEGGRHGFVLVMVVRLSWIMTGYFLQLRW